MIREAIADDAGKLVEMGWAFFQEAGHAGEFVFDPQSFLGSLEMLAGAGMLLVVEDGGEVVGMAAADVAPALWNRSILLGREQFWYIVPAHRKGTGVALLSALEQAAKRYGATTFDVVAEDGQRSEALGRLYRRASYNPAERTFRKRL